MRRPTLDEALALASATWPVESAANLALVVLRDEVERLRRFEVCLPGDQLHDLMQLLAGDDCSDDVMLAFYGPDVGHSGEGFYMYSADEPEEGSIKLDAELDSMREPRFR